MLPVLDNSASGALVFTAFLKVSACLKQCGHACVKVVNAGGLRRDCHITVSFYAFFLLLFFQYCVKANLKVLALSRACVLPEGKSAEGVSCGGAHVLCLLQCKAGSTQQAQYCWLLVLV